MSFVENIYEEAKQKIISNLKTRIQVCCDTFDCNFIANDNDIGFYDKETKKQSDVQSWGEQLLFDVAFAFKIYPDFPNIYCEGNK